MSVLYFDSFELDIENRRLSADGKALRLGSRAFDILAALATRAGQVVSKEELIRTVWPTTIVEEGALRVHLVSLRKSLGDEARKFIENVPSRGYQFLPDVRVSPRATTNRPANPIDKSTLPRTATKLLGREVFIRTTAEFFKTTRLLTIAGAGGIGKTSVAIAVAKLLSEQYRVLFLDLAAHSTGETLLPSLASQLGLSVYGSNVLPAIIGELQKSATLLVFDNCEHVVDEAARAAEEILKASPLTTILATSREPLRASLERVRQLPPLEVPPEGSSAVNPSEYAGLELFISLAGLVADESDFARPEAMTLAADIVRRLDGIPLAIELAAARAFDMDLESLHRSVADPLALLRRGRRTAPPRQQTLRAALDWSYNTLEPTQKDLLDRLSVFAGTFTADHARWVAAEDVSDEEFYDAFDGLFLKSLLNVSAAGGNYRLLVTTREYAATKLANSGFDQSCKLAHAKLCRARLAEAERDWTVLDTGSWLNEHGGLVHELRSALEWAFSKGGETRAGIDLVASSNIIWTQLGLMAEQLTHLERALAYFDQLDEVDALTEMNLQVSHGGTLYHIKSSERDQEAIEEFSKAKSIAENLRDHMNTLRAVGGMTAIHTMNGDYVEAISLALRFNDLFGNELPNAASRLLAHNFHYIGNFDAGLTHAKIALELAKGGVRGTLNNGASYDQRISALSTVVKTLWVQGKLSEARTLLASTFEEASALDHAISYCLFLSVSACPTAFGMGDHDLGVRLLSDLAEKATKNSLLRWQEWATTFHHVAKAVQSGNSDEFNQSLRNAKGARFENCLMAGGHLADDETLDRALSKNAGWCRAELYRLKGERLLLENAQDGRELIRRGYDLATEQGAKFWELRSATSLAKHAAEPHGQTERERLAETLSFFEGEALSLDVSEARKFA